MKTCPICGSELHVSRSSVVCDCCHVGVDLEYHTVLIGDSVPTYIMESWAAFRTILEKKVTLAVSKAQLFTEGFSLVDTIFYSDITKYDESVPEVIIGYCGVPAILFKALLFSYKETSNSFLSVIDELNPDTLLSAWFMANERTVDDFNYDESKVLSVVLSPTWVDCAEAIKANTVIDPLRMTESELIYCGLTCNKFPLLRDVPFADALTTLKFFMYEQSKFVHNQNPRLYRWNKPVDAALKDICPELMVVNTHTDSTFVDWLFATHTPWLITEEEAEPMRKPLKLLWERYGERFSIAKQLISKRYEVSNANTYIKYWEGIRATFSEVMSHIGDYGSGDSAANRTYRNSDKL